jgi:hypothetical protein
MDPAESIRRARVRELAQLEPEAAERRAQLEADYGKVWTTTEMADDFEVIGFAAPFIVVKRKADGQKGSLEFTHMPRFYFNWIAAD